MGSILLRTFNLNVKKLLLILLIMAFTNQTWASDWSLLEEDLWKREQEGLILYKTNLNKFDISIKKLSNDSTEEIPKSTELLVNASFFDTDFKPLGLLLEHGQIQNKLHQGGSVLTGILVKRNGFLAIKHRDQFPIAHLASYDLALQAGPRIIAGGQILSMKNADLAERRSGLCLNKERELILYITNKTEVISFPNLQRILLSKEVVCQDALNLDGGSSTQYYFYQNGKLADSIVGFSTVPVFLRLSRKP